MRPPLQSDPPQRRTSVSDCTLAQRVCVVGVFDSEAPFFFHKEHQHEAFCVAFGEVA